MSRKLILFSLILGLGVLLYTLYRVNEQGSSSPQKRGQGKAEEKEESQPKQKSKAKKQTKKSPPPGATSPTPKKSGQKAKTPEVNPYGDRLKGLWNDPVGKHVIFPVGREIIAFLDRNRSNAEEIQRKSLAVIEKLAPCLKTEDLCAQKPDPNTGYFDPKNTTYHNVLEQALEMLDQSIKMEGELTHIDPAVLNKALEVPHSGIQSKAMMILFNKDGKNHVKKHADQFKGQAKANYLKMGSGYMSESELSNEVISSIDKNDPATNLKVMKVLPQIKLSESTAKEVAKKSCYVKDATPTSSNIIYEQKVKAWSDGYNIDFDEICQ